MARDPSSSPSFSENWGWTQDDQRVMILFKDVSKIYSGNSVALQNINLKIRFGEFVSIAGRSGAGKSTLLKLITGEERPTRGKVILDKQVVNFLKSNELPLLRRRIGMVFQDFKLLAGKTAYENIAFAMEAAGKSSEEIEEDVPQVLELVGLAEKERHFPHQLSGGEKQRVAIARALINRPNILMADEPTGNLDFLHTRDIVNLLLKINELGTTVILATHDREIINFLKRRVVTLDKGQVISDKEKGKYIL